MEKRKYNFIDLTGQKMGRLTFLHYVGNNSNRNAIWRVRCDCGTEFDVLGVAVKSGNTKSCGCIKREMLLKRNSQRKKL
jgi:hypothetical protein